MPMRIGTLRLLEAIRILRPERQDALLPGLHLRTLRQGRRRCRRSETTPFYPRSPYAAAKLYAYWITVNYREAYGMHASNGILFNHEGPMRGETFVTRKITRAVAAIKLGLQDKLYLGNLDAKRDWGHARDYRRRHVADAAAGQARRLCAGHRRNPLGARVRRAGLRRMLAARSTGAARASTKSAGNENRGRALVRIDPRYFRPTEVDQLLGDASKARRVLGWQAKTKFDALVAEMVESDLKAVAQETARLDRAAH